MSINKKTNIKNVIKNIGEWTAPEIKSNISYGDMPGDKIEIGQNHINKSKVIFKELLKIILSECTDDKIVIAVCGGSGVGKSEIASLISFYFKEIGIGAYTMSGDNYPRRIPKYNDAERLRIFRNSGIRALVDSDIMNEEIHTVLQNIQEKDDDANRDNVQKYSWYSTYLNGAINGLKGYLGTDKEINFDEVSSIISQFKNGKDKIWLKRMGRTECDLWYDKVDFSDINILVIEWTHGNSDNYDGVDIPVLLNSTPEETLAHRKSRNRDGKTDSPFTTCVLEIEQQILSKQAHKAKIIISKSGELLTFDEYKEQMK